MESSDLLGEASYRPDKGDHIPDEDLREIFEAYSKIVHRQSDDLKRSRDSSSLDPRLMNPMGFATLYRLACREEGNLYHEMSLFHRFDIHNRGTLTCESFIEGWHRMEEENDAASNLILRDLYKLVGRKLHII